MKKSRQQSKQIGLVLLGLILVGCNSAGIPQIKMNSEVETSAALDLTIELADTFGRPGSGPGQFLQPRGLAVAAEEGLRYLWIADKGNQRIQILDRGGHFVTQWGKFGIGKGEFHDPVALLYANSQVYVSDAINHRIQVFDKQGHFIRSWGRLGREPGNFHYPQGLAQDSYGYLYVADRDNDRIQRFDEQGRLDKVYGAFGSGAGFLSRPTAVLAAKGTGTFLVLEAGNHRLQRFSDGGDFLGFLGQDASKSKNLKAPQAMVETEQGILFVADTAQNRVVVLNRRGQWLRVITAPPMQAPSGLAWDESTQCLYVSDTGHHRILKYHILGHE